MKTGSAVRILFLLLACSAMGLRLSKWKDATIPDANGRYPAEDPSQEPGEPVGASLVDVSSGAAADASVVPQGWPINPQNPVVKPDPKLQKVRLVGTPLKKAVVLDPNAKVVVAECPTAPCKLSQTEKDKQDALTGKLQIPVVVPDANLPDGPIKMKPAKITPEPVDDTVGEITLKGRTAKATVLPAPNSTKNIEKIIAGMSGGGSVVIGTPWDKSDQQDTMSNGDGVVEVVDKEALAAKRANRLTQLIQKYPEQAKAQLKEYGVSPESIIDYQRGVPPMQESNEVVVKGAKSNRVPVQENQVDGKSVQNVGQGAVDTFVRSTPIKPIKPLGSLLDLGEEGDSAEDAKDAARQAMKTAEETYEKAKSDSKGSDEEKKNVEKLKKEFLKAKEAFEKLDAAKAEAKVEEKKAEKKAAEKKVGDAKAAGDEKAAKEAKKEVEEKKEEEKKAEKKVEEKEKKVKETKKEKKEIGKKVEEEETKIIEKEEAKAEKKEEKAKSKAKKIVKVAEAKAQKIVEKAVEKVEKAEKKVEKAKEKTKDIKDPEAKAIAQKKVEKAEAKLASKKEKKVKAEAKAAKKVEKAKAKAQKKVAKGKNAVANAKADKASAILAKQANKQQKMQKKLAGLAEKKKKLQSIVSKLPSHESPVEREQVTKMIEQFIESLPEDEKPHVVFSSHTPVGVPKAYSVVNRAKLTIASLDRAFLQGQNMLKGIVKKRLVLMRQIKILRAQLRVAEGKPAQPPAPPASLPTLVIPNAPAVRAPGFTVHQVDLNAPQRLDLLTRLANTAKPSDAKGIIDDSNTQQLGAQSGTTACVGCGTSTLTINPEASGFKLNVPAPKMVTVMVPKVNGKPVATPTKAGLATPAVATKLANAAANKPSLIDEMKETEADEASLLQSELQDEEAAASDTAGMNKLALDLGIDSGNKDDADMSAVRGLMAKYKTLDTASEKVREIQIAEPADEISAIDISPSVDVDAILAAEEIKHHVMV